jgi:glycosyltransferase involved in cell wall biosynthesis
VRIVHVLEAVGAGAGAHVITLATELQRRGDAVLVAAPPRRAWGMTDPGFRDALRSRSIDLVEVPIHTLPTHPRNLRAATALAAAVRDFGADVVHSHSTAAGAVARPVARRVGVPSVHTPHAVRFADAHRSAAALAALMLERALASMTTRVVAVSPSEGEVLARAYPRDKIVVVPNGYDPPADVPPMPDVARVVSVQRLVHQKNPQLAVRIMGLVRQERVRSESLIVGGGSLRSEVQASIGSSGAGVVLDEATAGADAIASASVVLQTSRWEGASYVTLEAMALGRPVVSTDVVGSRDLVDDGVTGFLFDADRPDQAVAQLLRLLDDRELCERMGAAGRERVVRCYPVARMIDETRDVYRAAING